MWGCVVSLDTLNIECIYEMRADGAVPDWTRSDVHACIPVPGDIHPDCVGAMRDPVTQEIILVKDAEKTRAHEERYMMILRIERNARLQATDWTQMPDVSMSDDKKEAWNTYRQALRDLPSNTIDPENPVYPQAPIQ